MNNASIKINGLYIKIYKTRETGFRNGLKLRSQSQKSLLKNLRLWILAQIRENVNYILRSVYFFVTVEIKIFSIKILD